ncbi:MAG: hypothetical protein IAG13_33275, partial [Deltaproteobacteria bacterium]|nr:hypothetical protein [Nannocystaceae bacterium]
PADTSGDAGDDDGGSSDDGTPAGPHALGTIELGESHSANGGSPTPFVSAGFIPDATDLGDPYGCAEEVSGCFVQRPPECDECDVDEYCAYDDGCVATCMPLCDADCDSDEFCVFASPGRQECRPIEDFDAGILAFGDTAIPITLVPPYSWSPETSGSPFLSGATLLVQAGGAAAAGFVGFEHEFTGTTLVQTEIDDITVTEAYGDGPVPVRWVPGQDEVVVTVSAYGLEGSSGSATCPADDTTGAFDVPRAAIESVLGGDTLSSLGVGVRRTKTTQIEGLATTGMLTGVVVQPEGWLLLRTWSMEQHDVQGCAAGEAVCSDECVDVQFDAMHCGDCETVCDGACEYGECVGAGDSCAGICGEMAPSGCWCNPSCARFGDCCPDFAVQCG